MDAKALWPDENTSSALHWGWVAKELGSFFPLKDPLLLAFRGVKPCEPATHEVVAKPAYDDTYVLFDPGAASFPRVFAGATHSYQLDSKLSPDRDGDKRGDVGMIRPGKYVLSLALEKPYPIFTMATEDGSSQIPCFSDLNHDGRISPEEKAKAIAARSGVQVNSSGYYSTAVLLHTGWDAPPNSAHRSSISCLTMNFHDLLSVAYFAGLYNRRVLLNLVDAELAIEAAARFPRSSPKNLA